MQAEVEGQAPLQALGVELRDLPRPATGWRDPLGVWVDEALKVECCVGLVCILHLGGSLSWGRGVE